MKAKKLSPMMLEVMHYAVARWERLPDDSAAFSSFDAASSIVSGLSRDSRARSKTMEALVSRGLLRHVEAPYYDPSLGPLPPDAFVSRGHYYIIVHEAWKRWSEEAARAKREKEVGFERRHFGRPTAWDKLDTLKIGGES